MRSCLARLRAGAQPSIWRPKSAWQQQSSRLFASARAPTSEKPGLFGIKGVIGSQGLTKFTDSSLSKARELTALILDPNRTELKDVVIRLDVLSDTLCKAIDMCAFVRLTHPKPSMMQATQAAHEKLFDYMNELNTNEGLLLRLVEALETPSVVEQLSTEEVRVGQILRRDFEQSGAMLSEEVRQTFRQSSSLVSILGQKFLEDLGPRDSHVLFNSDDLDGVDPAIIVRCRSRLSRKVEIPLCTSLSELVLSSAKKSETREKLWRAQRTATVEQIKRLERFTLERKTVASISGWPSFAHYELSDKLIQNPKNALDFLEALLTTVRPQAKAELANLSQYMPEPGAEVKPWDVVYCLSRQAAARRGGPNRQTSRALSDYFALDNVISGFSKLCETLFGLSFRPSKPKPNEVWYPEVQKLDVYDGDEHVGIIYCDFFQRQGKLSAPAHYTIQCSRKIWPWEEEYATKKHQIPIIALVCNFPVHNGQCQLTYQEVQTLFHEMGHAVHTMLGRTDLQNVAGTRCATDFVEIPSMFFEKFAMSPQVLSLFAYDHEGNPLPNELLKAYQAVERQNDPYDTYTTIMLALIDQALHSTEVGTPNFSAKAIVERINAKYGIFPEINSEHWAQFSHITSYGAVYYSYLLDRCLANMIWDKYFAANPLSPESGKQLKENLLRWGGSRPAIDCIESMTGPLDCKQAANYISS